MRIVVRSLRLCVDIIVPDNANDTADYGPCDASQWEPSAKVSIWSRVSYRSGEVLLFHPISFICGSRGGHVDCSLCRHYLHSLRATWMQFICSNRVNTVLIVTMMYKKMFFLFTIIILKLCTQEQNFHI